MLSWPAAHTPRRDTRSPRAPRPGIAPGRRTVRALADRTPCRLDQDGRPATARRPPTPRCRTRSRWRQAPRNRPPTSEIGADRPSLRLRKHHASRACRVLHAHRDLRARAPGVLMRGAQGEADVPRPGGLVLRLRAIRDPGDTVTADVEVHGALDAAEA